MQIIKYFEILYKKKPIPFFIILLFLVPAFRTLLERLGDDQKTFIYAIDQYGTGYINSFTWFLYIVVVNTIGLGYFFNITDKEKFRNLVKLFMIYGSPLYVCVGFLDLVLSYNTLNLPVWYNIQGLIFPMYMPAGCLFGFIFSMILMPPLLKESFFQFEKKIKVIFYSYFVLLTSFLYGYQISLWIPYFLSHSIFQKSHLIPFFPIHFTIPILPRIYNIALESVLFIVPVLLLFPKFIFKIYKNDQEREVLNYFFSLIILVLIYILFVAIYCLDLYLKQSEITK
jgi:hypothetical protein